MNILISSASAKIPLIEGFRSALSQLNVAGKVIAADSNEAAPAARYADVFVQQPKDDDTDYASLWLDICRSCRVDLLVPTRDAELSALCRMKTLFAAEGVTVLTPGPKTLDICLDKIMFHQFCEAKGFPVLPKLSAPVAADLPLYARHRYGSGSRQAFLVSSSTQLATLSDNFLLQPLWAAPEYSIDVLFSLQGEPLQAVVRERIEVVAGESIVTRVCDRPELSALALALGEQLELVGAGVIQCFYDEENGPQLIECNPRFGGASMVSVAAGLASCERIVLELMGEKEQARQVRPIQVGEVINRRQLPPGVVL